MEKIDSKYSKLTDIYFPVLEYIVIQKKLKELENWMDNFYRIVSAIILLFSPLLSVSLAKLISLDQTKVQGRLNSLQSVVSVPKNCDAPIQLLHLLFREFLVDCSASDKFWSYEPAGHMQLAEYCLQCMNRELYRDICHLSSPDMKRNKINRAVLERDVSPELRYVYRYWIRYLENALQTLVKLSWLANFLQDIKFITQVWCLHPRCQLSGGSLRQSCPLLYASCHELSKDRAQSCRHSRAIQTGFSQWSSRPMAVY
ncbi:hypothetical protein BDV27DRAFT_151386 [Aspergillus caelatus]|uniref:Uncharacterized protein n=1 Tax=Aspergillus caelatus TaxID=61420 RepID=A0A5N6ZIB7_9EURO|nr:uncharacterized protein BDV27DRAFT_151386 [Aspergillus caelatus]KAE8357361.1 hypothetical protein BDV27DRAFT_151386 [Aspergillus caelatus]